MVKFAMQAKEKAEREKAKMEAQVEKLKRQQEGKGTTSDFNLRF